MVHISKLKAGKLNPELMEVDLHTKNQLNTCICICVEKKAGKLIIDGLTYRQT